MYHYFLNVFFLFSLGTKTRRKKFIHGLRKTPKLNPSSKPKKFLNVGIIQSTITAKKETLPVASTNNSSISSLVSADYGSSSSSSD